MVYPALLPLMRTPRLPIVDWTDAPADLNGLVRFAERQNLVSARVPSHFERSLHSWITDSSTFRALAAVLGWRGNTRSYRSMSEFAAKLMQHGFVSLHWCTRNNKSNISFGAIFVLTIVRYDEGNDNARHYLFVCELLPPDSRHPDGRQRHYHRITVAEVRNADDSTDDKIYGVYINKGMIRHDSLCVGKFQECLTFQSLLVTWCTSSLTFNNCTLCQNCIYVFCIYLRTNSDLCHLQHKLIGFYNRYEKCLQRGTDWVFK